MTSTEPTHSPGPQRRVPVSIVCVYNDEAVLDSCLRHSVAAQRAIAPETELLAVDNRDGEFATAGAALNHGARAARNDVVVLVHQDVVLHSVPALEQVAAELLDSPDIGILGAVGIDRARRILGRIRDRIVQIGESAPVPRDVDTLDEVLLMISTERLRRDPLSEDPMLAWHAYGVEYAVRMRQQGYRAVARDIPLTHNSLRTNLAKLDVAHRHVGDTYPDLLPIHTTCGTVHRTGAAATGVAGGLRRYNSARLWWGESLVARATRRLSPGSDRVLADIRMVVDEALEVGGKQSLRVIDLDLDAPVDYADDLVRFTRPFTISTGDVDRSRAAIADRAADELLVFAGLTDARLSALAPFGDQPHVVGNSAPTGRWAIVGATADELGSLWPSWRNRPVPGIA